MDSKGVTFTTLKYYESTLVRKTKLSPSNKARKKARQCWFMEENWVPDSVVSRQEAGESRGFPTLRRGIIDEDFQVEGKERKA